MDGFRLDRRKLLTTAAAAVVLPALPVLAASGDSPTAFADREIAAAGAKAPKVDYLLDAKLGAQAYSFVRIGSGIRVVAGDPAGAMYGGLDIAEALQAGKLDVLLADKKVRRPFIAARGIKFNIPLDLRTPSYADVGDSNQANIPEVWERDFWASYFDAMARHRYDTLTLWSLHPFTSMVKVPEYPDVALDDVWRGLTPLGPKPEDTRSKNLLTPEVLAHHEVVKTLTIDEKIAFWRDVMTMAHNRGIQVYLFTWNTYTYGTFGKYGITDALDNPATVAYMRASVREFVKTYPLLAGIGITAGEQMTADAERNEQWLYDTYGEGIRDALKAAPQRKVRLIHRFHETKGDTINRVWKDFPGFPDSFTFSHKYSVAHMYANPQPTFFERQVRPTLDGKKSWLTVRNDDIFSLRWGDPDYAREYLRNMPERQVLAGFYMGPDGFCWGRDFLDRETAGQKLGNNRPLVMDKQWYAFAIWGRLAYDPDLPNSAFADMLGRRFPGADADRLYATAAAASKVVPLTTSFFWRDLDYHWLPEAGAHRDGKGIVPNPGDSGAVWSYTVEEFMKGSAAQDAGILSIRDWRKQVAAGTKITQKTPLDMADAIAAASEAALKGVAELRVARTRGDKEWLQTLGDFEAFGYLGRYYAAKIRAAATLALFDASSDAVQQAEAIRLLEIELVAWKAYAAIHSRQYLPNFFSRLGFVDVAALTPQVARDVDIARNWKPGSLT